jgi:hypothetical protein
MRDGRILNPCDKHTADAVRKADMVETRVRCQTNRLRGM